MILSLQTRLLIAASVALAGFLGLTGLALDRAFQDSAETAVRNRLQVQLYGLLGAADVDSGGSLRVPTDLPESRFMQPGSGLYATVVGDDDQVLWRSPSLLSKGFSNSEHLAPGREVFQRDRLSNGETVFRYRFGTAWEDAGDGPVGLTFDVAENLEQYRQEVGVFRRSLGLWLSGSACVLLLVQGVTLGWGLRPLRKVAAEISEVERGRRQELATDYPAELRALTNNLNALLHNERSQRERYRDTLADLAHSLKTPLAVLRSLSESEWDRRAREEAALQVNRMQDIVTYQLQRARAGKVTFAQPVELLGAAEKVLRALRKVYADKGVRDSHDLTGELLFYGDSGDLYEVLGNVLENAFKYCHSAIWLTARQLRGAASPRPGLEIVVEDDGSGIEPALRERILKRGVRLDTRREGQGIGLAVAVDILAAYGGEIRIEDSSRGGARITLYFPPN